MTATFGDLFMFGSDYPHAEGLAHPLEDFQAAGGPPVGETTEGLTEATSSGFWVGEAPSAQCSGTGNDVNTRTDL